MIVCEKYANVKPLDDFDWSVYSDGWNGKSLKQNKKVKTSGNNAKIYCHESYAQKVYNKYCPSESNNEDDIITVPSKDLTEGSIIKIKSISLLSKDEILVSNETGGSAVVKLNKENKFFDMYSITKEEFKNVYFGTKEGREEFASQGYLAKIGKNGVASLYEGRLIQTKQEFLRQIALGNNATQAYTCKIVGSNKGGYIVNIQGVECFLPGSQAAGNLVRDFDSLIGTETQVMMVKCVESSGSFIVSRKKYLDKIRPLKISELREEWEENPDKIYTVTVTGATHFGIFAEMNEFYTGLIHKTYVTPEDFEKLKGTEDNPDGNAKENFPSGMQMDVKIYSISDDNSRIILTNILDNDTRNVLVEERMKIEAEETAKKKAEEENRKKVAEENRKKKMVAKADKKFKGETVNLEDLIS